MVEKNIFNQFWIRAVTQNVESRGMNSFWRYCTSSYEVVQDLQLHGVSEKQSIWLRSFYSKYIWRADHLFYSKRWMELKLAGPVNLGSISILIMLTLHNIEMGRNLHLWTLASILFIQGKNVGVLARNNSNTIIKFADDTTVVGLITSDNESAYREEVSDLAVWCQCQ